jgi:glycosyltransferase involved in cell wall biosynthesis
MSKSSLIVTHAIGNANVRAALSGFLKGGNLNAFYTAFACFESDLIYRLSKSGRLSEVRRRSYENDLQIFTRQHPFRELGRMIASKLKLSSLTTHESGYFCIDKVLHELDTSLAKEILNSKFIGANAVYAYEDGALEAFKAAKLKKMTCLYDLPIGYWRAARHLMKAEIELLPEWAPTITGFNDSESKLARKDEELQLADEIFVASSFTKSTLSFYPKVLNNIHVIPYGFPAVAQPKVYDYSKTRKLKVLFVGGLSQRKGIAYLFDAVKDFKNAVDLTIVGNTTGVDCPVLDQALLNCNWIPSLPHAEILKLMKSMDVLVFPSLFEGFGLVITEAMSQGTPVITTDRTAGPDVIQNGKNGWITEAGSSDAIKACLQNIIDQPDLLNEVGSKAYQSAAARPWSHYSNELNTAVETVLNTNTVNLVR